MKPGGVRSYRDLVAWQKAMDLAEKAYAVTADFPKEERFGLVAQMRRSAVSVPSNIAEGFGRGQRREFHRFLNVAQGSLFELQTQAELARRMGLMQGDGLTDLRNLAHEVDAVLSGLIRSVKQRIPDGK